MKLKVDIKEDVIQADDVFLRLGLDKGGAVQQFVHDGLADMFDSCVPFQSGQLKESVSKNRNFPYEEIVYDTPYAKRMYYSPSYKFNGGPVRGAFWDVRGWAAGGDAFVGSLQRFIENA